MADEPDDVDKMLDQQERASAIDAANNYRVMDNHLKHSDRVIANVAALRIASASSDDLIKAALENPT